MRFGPRSAAGKARHVARSPFVTTHSDRCAPARRYGSALMDLSRSHTAARCLMAMYSSVPTQRLRWSIQTVQTDVCPVDGIHRMKSSLLLAALASFAVGCASVSYRPVQEIDFHTLSSQGCQRGGDRFSVTALINSATREAIVLWDGRNNADSVAITLPPPGMGSKISGMFGKNRYELGYERLNQLRESGTPVTFSLRCEGDEMAPIADRYSYNDNGSRVEFEF